MWGIDHDLTTTRPDYDGGSIVNLMTSIGQRFGLEEDRFAYAPCRKLSADTFARARRIALVVIDGLGDELLAHVGADSALRRAQTATLTSVYPPTTASAVTTFMSGLAPQQHGLTGWFMHFRQLGTVAAVLPFMTRFGREPLSATGASLDQVVDAPGFGARIACRSQMLQPAHLADSDFSRLLGTGSDRQGYGSLEDFGARIESFCKGQTESEFLYAYWPELDTTAHLAGPSSTPVAGHYQSLDAALAPLLDVARAHDTLLLITADHGFIDSGANERIDVENHPELQAMLTLPLCGEPRSAYAYVRSSCVKAFEHYVESELGHAIEIQPSEALINDGWFGPGPAHPELPARVGDYVLMMRDRYTLRDLVAGERDMRLLGVHGGLSRAEQIVPLITSHS